MANKMKHRKRSSRKNQFEKTPFYMFYPHGEKCFKLKTARLSAALDALGAEQNNENVIEVTE